MRMGGGHHAESIWWRVYGDKLGAGPKRRVRMHVMFVVFCLHCVVWVYACVCPEVPPGRSCKNGMIVGVIMKTPPAGQGPSET